MQTSNPDEQYGDGTIAIARAVRETLRTRYQGIHSSDAEAQHMLVSGTIPIERRRNDIRNILSKVVAARSRNLFAQLLSLLQDARPFLCLRVVDPFCSLSTFMNLFARSVARRVFSSFRASLLRCSTLLAAMSPYRR